MASPATGHSRFASAVFLITELFEQILSQVDAKTLLLAQRVDKHWHGMISTSTPLQQKMFFRPATREQLPTIYAVERRLTTIPTNASGLGLRRKSYLNIHKLADPEDREQPDHKIIVYNALLFDRQIWRQPVLQPKIRLARVSAIRPSWERMLLTQPPQPKLVLAFENSDPSVPRTRHEATLAGDVLVTNVLIAAERDLLQAYGTKHFEGLHEYATPDRKVDMYLVGSDVPIAESDGLGLSELEA
ncbi:uncharacterized protein RHO25_000661 [Cercospora beticola]|uniref:F-box domain-containing protein n=1 Tax=Cercospora beticola TaxID=122368 RepID=A0ABZ0N946_CERBT|nr:hypothetical protein RHO25_000661 [Cercospora beticola]